MASELEPDTVTLAVDFNIAGSINDLDDVTRVKCSNGRIVNIGKVIRDFNAIDTGIFLCTPVIFDALEVEPGCGRRQHFRRHECACTSGQGSRIRHPGSALARRG